MRYRTIVVGTDGSDHALTAIRAAATVAKASRAKLTIAYSADRLSTAREVLARAEAAARDAGVEPSTELREGPAAADALIEIADMADADLVVIGNRGLSRARRMLLGSVSHRVAHAAPCDVLIVRRGPSAEGYRRALVATDGSTTADRCARKAYDLCARLGASATLLFVGHPKTGEIVLRDTHEMLEGKVEATFRIEQGDPSEKILDVAEDEGLDLIVVGNKGMGGKARFLLGPVPQKVMQHAGCDVLIARTATQVVTELAPGEGGIIKQDQRKVAVYRDPSGEVHAFSAKCTHLGCSVGWNPAERTWDCPCHGSRFAPTGEVLEGPATKPLVRTDL